MTNKTLQQIMDGEWHEARKRFHYPQLPKPKLVKDESNGAINLETLEITVSEPFITTFPQHGIDQADAFNEVLTHELTHYMRYPGSPLNVLRLQKATQGVVSGDDSHQIRTDFTEVQTNLHMLIERKHPATARMRKVFQPDEKDTRARIIYGLYQTASGQDFGVKLTKEEETAIKRLGGIDFLDKSRELENVRKFAEVMKDYKSQRPQNGSPGQENGGMPTSRSGMGMFNDAQILEGLRKFAQEANSPKEYEQIARAVLSEEEKAQQRGVHPGTGRDVTFLAHNFYSALAEAYAVPIRKKPMVITGSLYPHSHAAFTFEDQITDVDPFSAPGILPGITKKWVRKEGESHGDEEGVPSNLLVVDNSPSMFHVNGKIIPPNDRVYQHIVGATAVSNAYLLNGAQVAVYSFGSNDHLTGFSKDRERIHSELRRYSSDGGTTFNANLLETLVKQHDGVCDITVVSDMGISNLDGFVTSLLGLPQTHRVHLLYTNGSSEMRPYVAQLRQSFGKKPNVAILPLVASADISKITMGELKKSVH
ncbi:MAG: VWA domain-containing protein [Nanoarchaeota archaeon]